MRLVDRPAHVPAAVAVDVELMNSSLIAPAGLSEAIDRVGVQPPHLRHPPEGLASDDHHKWPPMLASFARRLSIGIRTQLDLAAAPQTNVSRQGWRGMHADRLHRRLLGLPRPDRDHN